MAAQLIEHRGRQLGEPVEYLVLRLGRSPCQGWPTDEELREFLKKDPSSSGTQYGGIMSFVTHNEMLPTPLLFVDVPGDTAHVELRKDNPCALHSTVTSAITQPTEWQAGYDAEGDLPRATGSLVKEPRKVRHAVLEGQVSSPTDPLESAMKDQPMPMLNEAAAAVTSGNLGIRNKFV